MMSNQTGTPGRHRFIFAITLAVASLFALPGRLAAQAPPPATTTRATPQRGTVKAIDASGLTLTTDTGQQVVIKVPPSARIQRLAPGSTDLKTAETAALSDVAVGDRVLISGAAGETPGSFTASRVILMKSGDIAQRHEAEQGDWKRRGISGIVQSVDAATGALTVSSGTRKLQITTSSATAFRRYADGSVKFEDAKAGTLAQIQAGDQLLARGAKSGDGLAVQAEEIVSGSFKNLAGTIVSVDAAKQSVTLRDLATKRSVTVQVTPNSALHRLPPEEAATLAASARSRSNSVAAPGRSGQAGTVAPGSAPARDARPASDQPASASAAPRSPRSEADRSAAGDYPRGHGGASDLSQIVARLPSLALADLHAGDAVMIVAEQSSSASSNLTAITLLAGVESILAAAPDGAAAMTLSPWSVGTGAPDAGGSQ